MIFDRAVSGVNRTNVDALFLSLAAVGVLVIESVNGKFRWYIAWEIDYANKNMDTSFYKTDDIRIGINMHHPNKKRTRAPVGSNPLK